MLTTTTLEQRVAAFKKEFEKDINDLTAKAIDEYTGIHHRDNMPVSELIQLINTLAVVHTQIMLKNILTLVSFSNNPKLGTDHLEAIQKDFDNSIANLGDLQEQLVNLLEITTTVESVH